MNPGTHTAFALALFAVAVAASSSARAQDCQPPCAPPSSCDRGTCVPATPPPAPAPPAPAPPSSAALPPAPPPAPPQPPPPAAPPPQPAPPIYYSPPPYAGPPPPAADPYGPPSQAAESTPDPARPGPFFGVTVGYGAPFGAQTIYEGDAAIGGGVGLLGSLGYMVGEHFGLGGFLHYNRATIDIPDNNDDFGDISAWALFYGVEARVAFTSKAVDGWASLGLALGTGQLTVSNELSSCNTTGCATVNAELNDEVTFGVMPTLAFGASARLTPQWGIGPAFRLYVLSIGEACRDYNVDGDGVDPGLDDCTSDTDEVAVPNVAFAGLELTFRP